MSKNIKPNGFNPEDTTYKEMVTDEDGKMRAAYHNKIVNLKRQEENLQDLENLLTELQNKNIRVVLIAPPVFSTYSKNLDGAIVHRTDKIVSDVVTKYNCQYKDYSSDPRFDITDFHDNDHLSYRGAEKFTKILDADFVKPLIQNGQ